MDHLPVPTFKVNLGPWMPHPGDTLSSQTWDAVIIGAGIIGAATAEELSQRGLKVLVIDQGELGHGCSYGNAGWITPCFAFPLPMPGQLRKAMGWLLDPTSPLYIQPRLSYSLFSWLWKFWLSMDETRARRAVAGLVGLSQYSLDYYQKLATSSETPFGFQKKGLLMLAQTEAGLHDAKVEQDWVAPLGVPGKLLSAAETKLLEPAVQGPLAGGVYFPEEANVEPLQTVQALITKAQQQGAVFAPRTEALGFDTSGRFVGAIHTTRGVIRTKQVIIATGAWTHSLMSKLDLSVPILGGKGYAFTLKWQEGEGSPANVPQIPLMMIERKIAVTPRQNGIRIAGTLELVDQDFTINPRRVEAIARGAQSFLDLPKPLRVEELWRGLRPCTPDGIPIIGPSGRWKNLSYACGHQMLGLQSAPGTARLLADLMLGKKTLWNPAIFSPNRSGLRL